MHVFTVIPAAVLKVVNRQWLYPFLVWLDTVLASVIAGSPAIEVDAVATSALAACTYANGTLGVGATLTGDANGAFATIDGLAPALNQTYLITGQVATLQNGPYKLTQVGAGGTPFILTRLVAYDVAAEFREGALIGVRSGTVNAGTTWTQTSDDAPVVGTDPITFARAPGTVTTNTAQTISAVKTFSAAPVFGAGLTASGAVANNFGGGTGDFAASTGAFSWAGAAGKALSFVATTAAMTLTAAATSIWSTTVGNLTVDAAASLLLGVTNALDITIGRATKIITFAGRTARGATTNLIADPGTGQAIPVTADGVCAITIGSAGAETNTLAAPTYIDQQLSIIADVVGTGTRAVTVASAFNQTGNTVLTFAQVKDACTLTCMQVAGVKVWRLTYNDGVALS